MSAELLAGRRWGRWGAVPKVHAVRPEDVNELMRHGRSICGVEACRVTGATGHPLTPFRVYDETYDQCRRCAALRDKRHVELP